MAIFVSMASLRERRRADGTRSFAVLWRDPDTGRQTSLTYDDEREAKVVKELIEAAGGYATEAARIAEAVRKPGPTVLEAISEHIELLTGVGADTRSHYRRQLTAHIAPVIGAYPVSALTYRHVAGWVRTMTAKGLASKTVATVHGLLSAAMTTATRLGYRTDNPCVGVSLPEDLVDVLLPLVAAKAPDALLFTNTVGSQISSSRFWTTTWTPALDAACNPRRADGAPDLDAPRRTKRPRVHDLRHTHASWMIARGRTCSCCSGGSGTSRSPRPRRRTPI